MEAEIVFCERCGVSIPEGEVARTRQASGGRNLCTHCLVPPREGEGDLQLYFCENCRVSIAVSDVLTQSARPEGPGYLCAVCSRSSPAERVARRTAVERELAAAVPAGAPPRPGADPLYFCDMCNSSIPAALVATGRALVQSGRTYCERCRPRVEARGTRARPGVGAAPVVAAALLAALAASAGFVAWERWQAGQEGDRETSAVDQSLAKLQQEVRRLRETGETARADLSERTDRGSRELERKIESLRTEVQAARAVADRSAAQAAGTERIVRLERVAADLEEQIRLLREDLAALGARRGTAELPEDGGGSGSGGGSAPPPPAVPAPEAPPGPGPAPGTGPAAPAAPSPEVQRCIALLKDRDAGVRFSAAIELGKLGDRSAWPSLVDSLRKDDDPFVRRACARSIGELKAFEAFPDLCDALTDGEEYVAVQSSRVLKEMAGQDFGFKQNQARADRRRVSERAKKWWEENRDRLAPGARGE